MININYWFKWSNMLCIFQQFLSHLSVLSRAYFRYKSFFLMPIFTQGWNEMEYVLTQITNIEDEKQKKYNQSSWIMKIKYNTNTQPWMDMTYLWSFWVSEGIVDGKWLIGNFFLFHLHYFFFTPFLHFNAS